MSFALKAKEDQERFQGNPKLRSAKPKNPKSKVQVHHTGELVVPPLVSPPARTTTHHLFGESAVPTDLVMEDCDDTPLKNNVSHENGLLNLPVVSPEKILSTTPSTLARDSLEKTQFSSSCSTMEDSHGGIIQNVSIFKDLLDEENRMKAVHALSELMFKQRSEKHRIKYKYEKCKAEKNVLLKERTAMQAEIKSLRGQLKAAEIKLGRKNNTFDSFQSVFDLVFISVCIVSSIVVLLRCCSPHLFCVFAS